MIPRDPRQLAPRQASRHSEPDPQAPDGRCPVLIAIAVAAVLLAVTFVALRLIGRACLTCSKPVIDCRCPEPAEPDEVDPDFAASVAAGFVQLPTWDPAPVYPRHPKTPKEGA